MKIYVNRSYLGSWGWPILRSILLGYSQGAGLVTGGAYVVPQIINAGSWYNILVSLKLWLTAGTSCAVLNFYSAIKKSPLDPEQLFTEDKPLKVEIVNPPTTPPEVGSVKRDDSAIP